MSVSALKYSVRFSFERMFKICLNHLNACSFSKRKAFKIPIQILFKQKFKLCLNHLKMCSLSNSEAFEICGWCFGMPPGVNKNI